MTALNRTIGNYRKDLSFSSSTEKKDSEEIEAEEFKKAHIDNSLVSANDLLNLTREVSKTAKEFLKFIAENSRYLDLDSKNKIDGFIHEAKNLFANFQKIQPALNQKIENRKETENRERKSLIQQVPDVRKILYAMCDLKTLGKFYLTSNMIGIESSNFLIERAKSSDSYMFQYDLLRHNRDSLKCANSWIRNAEKISSLRFISSLDSNWLDCLAAAGDKKIEKLFIDDLRPRDIEIIRKLRSSMFERHIKSINLTISFNDGIYDQQGRGPIPSPAEAPIIVRPLLGEDYVPYVFGAFPDVLSSLELSGSYIESNPLEHTIHELSDFGRLPHVEKLILRRWVIKNSIDESISFKFFHSSLRELRITESRNRITNLDIADLPNLEILEMDKSLGLTAHCFEKLPRTIIDLSITVWPVKIPHHVLPAKCLSLLPPNLKKFQLIVLSKPRTVPLDVDIAKYELKMKHIKSLSMCLTSLGCTWQQEITEKNIKAHLTNLTELKPC